MTKGINNPQSIVTVQEFSESLSRGYRLLTRPIKGGPFEKSITAADKIMIDFLRCLLKMICNECSGVFTEEAVKCPTCAAPITELSKSEKFTKSLIDVESALENANKRSKRDKIISFSICIAISTGIIAYGIGDGLLCFVMSFGCLIMNSQYDTIRKLKMRKKLILKYDSPF